MPKTQGQQWPDPSGQTRVARPELVTLSYILAYVSYVRVPGCLLQQGWRGMFSVCIYLCLLPSSFPSQRVG